MGIDRNSYKSRIVDSIIKTYLGVSGAVCIEGPKWCGKTWTSTYHSKSEFMVGDPQNNFSNRKLAEIDPVSILKGDTPRLIDEWQEVPSIWDAVRAEIDRRNKKGQIILTGSATPQTKGIMHSGAGRILKLRMNTMSLYESGDSSGEISLHELCNGALETKMLSDIQLEKLAYYIVRGGWPANISAGINEAHIMPISYVDTLIDENINSVDDETRYSTSKFKLLLRSLARNESTTASELSLLNDIIGHEKENMSRNTLGKYLDKLNRLFVTNNQLPFSANLRSSLRVKQFEKRHFSDPAIACALLNITPKKLMQDLNTFGLLFEALVVRDLGIYAQSFGAKLFHYQDYKNNELDAVIELDNGEWCAFEIKLGCNKIDEGANSLIRTCLEIEKNGGKPAKIKCVICGLSNAAYQRKDGVYVVPVTSLKD